MILRFAAVACALVCITPAFAADRRVYKIDSLIATQKNGEILIQAKGAVQSGGWSKARLHVVHADAHNVLVEFLATPPPPGMTVIEALVPVTASAEVRSRAASVHAQADVNEITTQVLR
jgi:hypothetical protein